MKSLFLLITVVVCVASCKKDEPTPPAPKTQYYIKYVTFIPEKNASYEFRDGKGVIRTMPSDSMLRISGDSFIVESGFHAYLKVKKIGTQVGTLMILDSKTKNYVSGCQNVKDSCQIEWILP